MQTDRKSFHFRPLFIGVLDKFSRSTGKSSSSRDVFLVPMVAKLSKVLVSDVSGENVSLFQNRQRRILTIE